MKLKIFDIICITITFLIGCINNNQMNKIIVNDSLFTKIMIEPANCKEDILESELFDSVFIVPLETKNSCFLGKIDKIEIFNNKIYVLDQEISCCLFVFDLNGKFLFKVGQKGRGPGEYQCVLDFSLNPSN